MEKPASLVATIVLWLIALVQLLRLIFQLEVTVQSIDIPRWVSGMTFVVLGVMGVWLWRERRE